MQLSSVLELKNQVRALIDDERVRGDELPQVAIGITTAAKRDQHRLAVRAADAAALQHEVVAYIRRQTDEVDIRITGAISANPGVSPVATAKSLRIGASVGHYQSTAGTLGFFGRRSRDGVIGIVSNNHVLAMCDHGVDQDPILHPAAADRGRRPKDVVARLAGDYPRLSDGNIDCAFAPLLHKVAFEPRSLAGRERLAASPARAADDPDVRKIGRTTALTSGRVTAFDLDNLIVNYGSGTMSFQGQLEVESATENAFTMPGDSGSLVFNRGGNPVGLVFANCPVGGSNGLGMTYAHPIERVLEALGVALLD